MSMEANIHPAQVNILRELLFRPQAGYGELQKPTGLTSDHFNFHMSRLVELGLVTKISRGRYKLSARGKEYANRLDTDNNTIERQPKSAVIIGLTRSGRNGDTEYLFQQRLKNPYYGFWGLPSGKVRWGETVAETAHRESLEETGLTADFMVVSLYHEQVRSSESGLIIEDKVFFMVRGGNVRGDLQVDFEGGHNEWLTLNEVLKQPDKYQTLAYEVGLLETGAWFNEQTVSYSDQEF